MRIFPLILLVLLTGTATLFAQSYESVGNEDIAVHAVNNPKSGRFWITGGTYYRDTLKFLYASGPSFVTSNIVFRVKRNNQTRYFGNLPPTSAPAQKPKNPETGADVEYRPYDSMVVAPTKDTLSIYWSKLDGYNIVLRFMPEKRQTIYDRGSDMLMEFHYMPDAFSGTGELGIMLMLDVYNNNAVTTSGGGTGDNASVLTSSGFYPSQSYGKKFVPPFEQIPEWYHVGNFTTGLPLNTVYPIHRLRDTSHGGRKLSTPNLFAIGHWPDFRLVGWELPSNLGTQVFTDAATVTRWDNLQGEGKVVTAFGVSDREGNNMFTCRDSSLFIDIRTQRVTEQKTPNGAYSPQKINVEMWVTNTEHRFSNNVDIQLVDPMPFSGGRLSIDPSTPAKQGAALAPGATRKLNWILNIDPSIGDSTDVQLRFYHIYEGKPVRTFRQACTPTITIRGYRPPPPPQDTMDPVITRTGSGRDTTAFTTFTTFDRHQGYNYDTGLDRIVPLEASNYSLYVTQTNFTRCDVNVNVDLTARVIDTTVAAKLIFRVYDCKGNFSDDTVTYAPFPDLFNPHIETRVVTEPGIWSVECNARVHEVRLSDTLQTANAGDAGFGVIEVVGTADNFTFELNPDNGGSPITMFDRFASFRVTVQDTMRDGRIEIRYADAAGNDSTMEFTYCTLPDFLPPIALTAWEPATKRWTINVTDSLSWDRGLYAVNILENRGNNVRLVPDPVAIVPGADSATFVAEVIDDAFDAYIVLEVTDLKSMEIPDGHADTVVLAYTKNDDERAPNIAITDVADPQRVLFDVDVNDIHYDGTDLYRYDLGLATVTTPLVSANIRLVTPIPAFTPGDMTLPTFRVEVVDTLAFSVADTLVVQATDLAGNVSVDTLFYPIKPDRLVPRFDGGMDAGRTVITGQVTDDRAYDRGLGSVTVVNGVNLDPAFALDGLNGIKTSQVTIRVTDPEEPISGTLVWRDLIGDRDRTAETQKLHAGQLEFALPVAGVTVVLPNIIEGGEEISAAVVATRGFSGSDISSLSFNVFGSAAAGYVRATNLTVGTVSPGEYSVRFETDPFSQYGVGDTLGRLYFRSSANTGIQRFDLRLSSDAPVVNDGAWSTVYAFNGGDTVGTLRLPPPLLKLAADSLTWINGTCERILSARQGASKNGLAILGVRPQPVSTGGDRSVEIDVRDLPADGGTAELVAADGRRLALYTLSPTAGQLVRLRIDLPEGASSGVYFFRVTAGTGVAVERVVVVD